MKKIFVVLAFTVATFLAIAFTNNTQAYALSWDYPDYDVTIKIEPTTEFNVEENATFRFTGDLTGLRRDITLHNEENKQKCSANPSYTCGGFEFLVFNNLTLDRDKLSEGEYKLYEVTDDLNSRFFRIEKRLFEEATFVNGRQYNWVFDYDVYGGIQWLKNSAGDKVPYFYWNILPEDRGGDVESSVIKIIMPSNVKISVDKFEILTQFPIDYEYRVNRVENSIEVTIKNLPDYTPVTFYYEFADGDLTPTGDLVLDYQNARFGTTAYWDGREIDALKDGALGSMPAGKHTVSFKRFGYQDFDQEVNIESGKTVTVEVNMTPHLWMAFLILVTNALFVLGILLVPVAAWYAYNRYNKKGRDINPVRTIIPKFSPPKGVAPYLLGSLKDEKVGNIDITGTIIDLAYRGFIKIKEIKKKTNYELTKLEGKKDEELNKIEEAIMDAIFGGKDKKETKDLQTPSFVNKINSIKKDIDTEMKDRGYFDKSPQSVRTSYYLAGSGLLTLGGILAVGGSVILISLIGDFVLFTIGLAILTLGIGYLIIANFMPAKTAEGSKVYGDILGFRMYLKTAERFRLQGLKPEEFEKYLSYAVVFGVEKEWAKSFEDIYKQKPNWYEGSGDFTDAYFISSFTRSFTTAATNSMRPVTSSSGSGSGWSGGGSFGGFSGGGGGGGASGGW